MFSYASMKHILVVGCLSVLIHHATSQDTPSNIIQKRNVNTPPAVEIAGLIQAGPRIPERKECPPDFSFLGKQCVRTITEPPIYTCDPGKTLVQDKCAQYAQKVPECPPNFATTKNMCLKQKVTGNDVLCPDGFQLIDGNMCSRKVKLPEIQLCPPETVQIGELCIRKRWYPADYVCPKNYTLRERKCVREEVYDCTPPHPVVDKNVEPREDARGGTPLFDYANRPGMPNRPIRYDFVAEGKGKVNRYTLYQEPPVVEEVLIKKMCKRTITENARPLCQPGGYFQGKMCLAEEPVPHTVKSGGYKDEKAPAIFRCPPKYTLEHTSPGMRCVALEERLPTMVCPPGYEGVGARCASFTNARLECPIGFSLTHEKECHKTIFGNPITHYTVKYTCQGKNCDAKIP